MKTLLLSVSACLVVLLSSFVASVQGVPDRYKFSASACSVNWKTSGEEIESHVGTLDIKSGNLQFDSKTLVGGFAYINMRTLKVTDISDAGFNREHIVQMQSAEELNVGKYVETTFKVLKAKRLDVADGKPNYDITGTVKIKGKTVPVKFTATIKKSKKDVSMKASFKLPAEQAALPYDLELKIQFKGKLAN